MHQENQKVFDFYTVFFLVANLFYSIVFAENRCIGALFFAFSCLPGVLLQCFQS